ncbi:hypothetical protein GDO78_014204 [Eleutherodactylus coqui]|uniref:Uncharacterized protein n=1 Tax=Eleutherodactylus coqui TaxID=57060 RepID=A0A8J6B6S4_ELECQ|nr:hypothetical protein GDO78_014204 [Eleutherodactylus coqui]
MLGVVIIQNSPVQKLLLERQTSLVTGKGAEICCSPSAKSRSTQLLDGSSSPPGLQPMADYKSQHVLWLTMLSGSYSFASGWKRWTRSEM